MLVFSFSNSQAELDQTPWQVGRALPPHSVIFRNTPFLDSLKKADFPAFFSKCKALRDSISHARLIFIDATWDPIRLSNKQIQNYLEEMKPYFPKSRIVLLSSRAQHWFDNLPNCVYYPAFLMIPYHQYPNWQNLADHPRSGRIGCLNRNAKSHRSWLMHTLMRDKLIDAERDVYSVSHVGLYDNAYIDVDGWLNSAGNTDLKINDEIRQGPDSVATNPDNFPNDYTINHPAWGTGISIITETEPGEDTILSEKTAEGILSKSCFSIYMSDVGYRVLEQLGFEPRFFRDHAHDTNIKPLINLCRQIDTEALAMDYRQQQMRQIQHNYNWADFGNDSYQATGWYARYQPKLHYALSNL